MLPNRPIRRCWPQTNDYSYSFAFWEYEYSRSAFKQPVVKFRARNLSSGGGVPKHFYFETPVASGCAFVLFCCGWVGEKKSSNAPRGIPQKSFCRNLIGQRPLSDDSSGCFYLSRQLTVATVRNNLTVFLGQFIPRFTTNFMRKCTPPGAQKWNVKDKLSTRSSWRVKG